MLGQMQVALMQSPCMTEALVQQYRQALLQLCRPYGWAAMVDALNDLINAWVDLYAAGLSLDSMETVLKPIKVPQWFSRTRTLGFRRFLCQLFAESAASHDHAAIEYTKSHHQLSGLPNGYSLTKQLTPLLFSTEDQVGLILVNFKLTPIMAKSQGHPPHKLAIEVIKRLQQSLAEGQSLFHLEAYEFAVLVPLTGAIGELDAVSAKLRRPFERSVHADQQLFCASPVMGGVMRHFTHRKVEDMLSQARLALEEAQHTCQPFLLHTETMTSQTVADQRLRQEVLDAFKENRFSLYLQPVVDAQTGRCLSAEALLRCYSQDGALIPSPFVIEVMYQQGLGNMFIRWLSNSVCKIASMLKQQNSHPIYFSMNLHADDLINPELPYLFARALDRWNVEGPSLMLEFQVSSLQVNEVVASATLLALHALGCRIALDDFATGDPGISHLRDLPIEVVKIGQDFISHLAESPEDKAIVQGLVTVAHGLGKLVVAEGVADADCLAIIRASQCDQVQGYYFSKPLPVDAFLPWLNTHGLGQSWAQTAA